MKGLREEKRRFRRLSRKNLSVLRAVSTEASATEELSVLYTFVYLHYFEGFFLHGSNHELLFHDVSFFHCCIVSCSLDKLCIVWYCVIVLYCKPLKHKC